MRTVSAALLLVAAPLAAGAAEVPAQSEISAEISRAQVGGRVEAFVEGLSAKEQKRRPGPVCSSKGSIPLTVGGRVPSACGEGLSHSEESGGETPDRRLQLAGRTDTDLIVLFDLPDGAAADDFIGSIVPVRITRSTALSLFGEIER